MERPPSAVGSASWMVDEVTLGVSAFHKTFKRSLGGDDKGDPSGNSDEKGKDASPKPSKGEPKN